MLILFYIISFLSPILIDRIGISMTYVLLHKNKKHYLSFIICNMNTILLSIYYLLLFIILPIHHSLLLQSIFLLVIIFPFYKYLEWNETEEIEFRKILSEMIKLEKTIHNN